MKRSMTLTHMFAAALVLAAQSATAGDIVKCVDGSGHVTLTDQPCTAGAASVRLDQDTPQDGARAARTPQRHVLPAADLRQWKRPDLSRPVPLTRDVATLKEARRTLMLQDAKASLAGLP